MGSRPVATLSGFLTGLLPWFLAGTAPGAEEDAIPHRQDRPPNQPYSPDEAIRRMTVPAGFTVELVASEPDIVNPVAMTFDDRGRIWIAETVEYPRKEPGRGRDRIKVLEDTDLDGRADRFTVFAEGLNIPTGIAVGHGGVWVANAPDLLFLTERDGKEASREVIVTGFGRADTHELPNSLTWGPDGWLYGLNGVFNPSRIASGGREHRFTCALFRVHPRTRELEVFCEGTSNPWGLAWDPEGSAIVSACHWANDHLFHFVETGYYQRQAGAYPPYTMKIGSVSNHGHQKTAYCGLAYFDSEAYPEEYRGLLYMGNVHGNCINVDRLRRDGSTYISTAEPDFLAANDAWFLPVAQKVGPDGCLYILDWYDRYHCYQDANRDPGGVDRLKGRLYRVRYGSSPRAARFDLAAESDEEIAGRLSSPNIYFRESAQRILAERSTGSSRARLKDLVLDGAASRRARLHALWSLLGSGPLEPELHSRLLAHPDPAFRSWGVRAAGNARMAGGSLRERVALLARDPAPEVKLQVAIAARKIEGVDPMPILVEVLSTCGQDKLIPSIVWPNLHPLLEEESRRFARFVEAADLNGSPALLALLPRVVDRLPSCRRLDPASVAALVDVLAARDPGRAGESLSAIGRQAVRLSESDIAALRVSLAPGVRRIISEHASGALRWSARLLAARLGLEAPDAGHVRSTFLSASEPDAVRIEALEALISFRDPSLLEAAGAALTSGETTFLRRMLGTLGKSDDPALAGLILDRYPLLDRELQPLAVDLLMEREPWARQLLEAVQKKRIPAAALHANHLRKILDANDREAIWAVEKTWGVVRSDRNPERQRVVARMTDFLSRSRGDPVRGEQVFRKLCSQCHAIHGKGQNVGPDLTANGRASFEQLVSNVFDPSLVIGPGYQVTTVVTADGRNLTGIAVEESDQRIVLRMAGGVEEAVARGKVKYSSLSQLSMMPEGIETSLDPGEISDLFAFLTIEKQPGDPAARPIPGTPLPPPAGGR